MNFDRMRALLLEQAVQGKLVPQRNDEPAVEQIGEAPKIEPFAIPKKWKWVRLNAVGKVIGGGTPKTGVSAYWNGDIPWITPADLGKNHDQIIYSGAKSITQKGLDESAARLMPKGSIVYSSRAPIGHIAIAGNDLCTNQGCKSFVPESKCISTEWAYYMLIARTSDIQSRASGTTFKEISGKGMGETWISLPPLPEQIRIVTKIEKSFTEINRAEKAYRELQTLTAVLRKKILQEAVMGKLVPQLDGEPAVEQIGDAPEDVPFAIPGKWKWVQLKRLVQSASQKVPDKAFTYIDVSSINGFKITSPKRLDASSAPSRARKIVQSGSVLYSTVRPYLMNVCVIDRVEEETIASTAFATMLCREAIINTFLFYVLISPFFTEYVKSVQRGASYPAITDRDLQRAWIPVPPIEEQHRIVAKVEELMAQVDRLAT